MVTLTWHTDETEVQGEVSSTTIPFDYLIYAVGAETQTFGIPGVKEHACFMKEIQDADKVCSRLMYEYIEEIPTGFSSSRVASWIVRYSTEALGLPKSHHCLRRRVGWFPRSTRGGDRSFAPHGKNCLRISGAAADKTRLSLGVGQLGLKSGWVMQLSRPTLF
jgi:hypothetical protein